MLRLSDVIRSPVFPPRWPDTHEVWLFAQEQPTLASRRLAWLSSGLWVGSAAAGVALANGGQACRVFHRKPSLLPPGVLGTLPFHPGSRQGGARELRWALITSDNTRSCRQTTWGLGNCLLNASFSGALQNAHSEHDKLADALDSGRRKGTAHAAGRSAWLRGGSGPDQQQHFTHLW